MYAHINFFMRDSVRIYFCMCMHVDPSVHLYSSVLCVWNEWCLVSDGVFFHVLVRVIVDLVPLYYPTTLLQILFGSILAVYVQVEREGLPIQGDAMPSSDGFSERRYEPGKRQIWEILRLARNVWDFQRSEVYCGKKENRVDIHASETKVKLFHYRLPSAWLQNYILCIAHYSIYETGVYTGSFHLST